MSFPSREDLQAHEYCSISGGCSHIIIDGQHYNRKDFKAREERDLTLRPYTKEDLIFGVAGTMPAKEEATMPAKEEGTIPDREENTIPGKEEESKPATGSTSEEEQERAGEAEVKDPSSSKEEKG